MRVKIHKKDIKPKHNFMNIIAYPARQNEHVAPPELASAYGARPSGRAMNDCRNLGTNARKVVRTYFTIIQVGRFC
jgi:hypothetical protein